MSWKVPSHTATGVIASLSRPLAEAGISLFPLATYDTDYLLVKDRDARRAAEVWQRGGHVVR